MRLVLVRHADAAPGTGAVLDDERPAEPLRQPLADQPCNDVDVVASGESDDDVHRPRRVGLRPSETRNGWQRGRTAEIADVEVASIAPRVDAQAYALMSLMKTDTCADGMSAAAEKGGFRHVPLIAR